MENLVIINNGQAVTNSLLVAEIFGKEHSKVCRDIENLSCSDDFRAANFGVSFTLRGLPNSGHKQERYFEMTKDGFSFLVMGYTGAKAGEFKELFINEFNKRTAMLQSDDYILMRSQEILQNKVKALESKAHQLQGQVKEAEPKIEWFDQNQASVGVHTMTVCVEKLSISADNMNKVLMRYKIIRKTGGEYSFMAQYQNKGYGEQIPVSAGICSDGTPRTRLELRYTEKGRNLIHKIFYHAVSDGFITRRRDGRWVMSTNYGYTKFKPGNDLHQSA